MIRFHARARAGVSRISTSQLPGHIVRSVTLVVAAPARRSRVSPFTHRRGHKHAEINLGMPETLGSCGAWTELRHQTISSLGAQAKWNSFRALPVAPKISLAARIPVRCSGSGHPSLKPLWPARW